MTEKNSKLPLDLKKHYTRSAQGPSHIVGIGASAGGLKALRTFLTHMPASSGLAFVIITHLDPEHESHLTELLATHTSMQFAEVKDGVSVSADTVYVIRPGTALEMEAGVLRIVEPKSIGGAHHPIDQFLLTLARDQGERAVCIILSGAGSDGSVGLKAIKQHGGIVLVQSEATAQFPDMPANAIATGQVDLVLAVEEMPDKLVEYCHVTAAGSEAPAISDINKQIKELLPVICKVLHAQVGHNFSDYKENTILRRVERRMIFQGFKTALDYVSYLQKTPAEAEALFKDLLIGVTSFFRDPEAFAVLQQQALSKLIAAKQKGDVLRIWIAGCGTGEEAYSMAILVHECLARAGKGLELKIFATDLNEKAIESARSGVYAPTIADHVSNERLQKYFEPVNGSYQISGPVRDSIVFATHNILQDPPFSNMDLICCRNLLIYLNSQLQETVLELFFFALQPEGYLFLGAAENISSAEDLFSPVDKTWKIYQRRMAVTQAHKHFRKVLSTVRPPKHKKIERTEEKKRENIADLAEKILLEKYTPPCVIINQKYEVVFYSNSTARFLKPPVGEPTHKILSLVREELRLPLRALLHEASTKNQTVISKPVELQDDNTLRAVNLIVEPLQKPQQARGLAILVIKEIALPQLEAQQKPSPDDEQHDQDKQLLIQHLEDELSRTSEELRLTIDESETTTEELKASNEELMSLNEELQSTNEELETSKEELSSVNDELLSVNAELQNKLVELEEANSDILNLLTSTQIATVFLDKDLKVKRFTGPMAEIFNLIESDIGRPLQHLKCNIDAPGIIEDAGRVLKTLHGVTREVAGEHGMWYLMRILPYRTVRDLIDGVVITLIDISERKIAEDIQQKNTLRLEALVQLNQMSSAPFQKLAQLVAVKARQLSDSEFGLVALIDDDQCRVEDLAFSGNLDAFSEKTEDKSAREMLGAAIQLTGPTILNDLSGVDPVSVYLRKVKDAGPERLMIVPVRDKQKLVAIAVLGNKKTKYEDNDLKQFLPLLNGLWAIILRERAHAELEKARIAAENASRAKDMFLATMSHEIRTPLTGVIGWIEVVLSTELTVQQKKHLEMALSSSLLLSQILEDILDFSKIKAGRLDLKRKSFCLRSCLQEVFDLFSAAVSEKNLELKMTVDDDIPDDLIGDELRLRQVLGNLLSNAVKFTKKGRVELDVSRNTQIDDASDKSTIVFRVSDTGVGIPAEKFSCLFEAFSQVDDSLTREYGGSGLGLAICKELVDSMGGSITVQSKLGKGSEFSVAIPFTQHEPQVAKRDKMTRAPRKTKRPSSAHILIAEDEPMIVALLEELLKDQNYTYETANNGLDVITKWRAGEFDLILMDVQMPNMNGLDVTRAIRNEEVSKSKDLHIPIVALTAHASEDDRRRCIEAGMDAYVGKPISQEDFYQAIRNGLLTKQSS